MAKKGWGKPFEDPILLPDDRELITLKDDARRMGRRDRNHLPTIRHGVLLQAMVGVRKDQTGRTYLGQTFDEMPHAAT
jgi:hypothetical protein